MGGSAACVVAVLAVALLRNGPTSAAPKPDLKPTAHWVFDGDGVTGKTVADRVGKLPGTLLGTPQLVTDGPTPHLHLTGPDDGVMIKPRVAPDAAYLPQESLSVVAWVRVDESSEWAGNAHPYISYFLLLCPHAQTNLRSHLPAACPAKF